AAHLAQASCERTLYIFDEPTTGLHFDDIAKLLAALQRLIENGGSLLIIEHNLDVIQAADWVIDLGPEGGALGGYVVATGTPEDIARSAGSHTGRFLAQTEEASQKSQVKSQKSKVLRATGSALPRCDFTATVRHSRSSRT